MSKHENILQNLSISATPGVDDKGDIYYTALVTTLQTASVWVDDESNNIIKVEANPAYQQPDAVVQQYLGEQLALLVVGPIEAANAAKKEAQDALTAANEQHATALAAKDTEKAQALTAKDTEITTLKEQHTAALAAKETEKGALQTQLTAATALAAKYETALGGTEAGQVILAEKAKQAALEQFAAAKRLAKEHGIDPVAEAAKE